MNGYNRPLRRLASLPNIKPSTSYDASWHMHKGKRKISYSTIEKKAVQLLMLLAFLLAMRLLHLRSTLLVIMGSGTNDDRKLSTVMKGDNRLEKSLQEEQKAFWQMAREAQQQREKPNAHMEGEPTGITSEQWRFLHFNQSREKLLVHAMKQLHDTTKRTLLDPLAEHNHMVGNQSNRVSFKPQVKYLGVLIDAGRHYFPIPWLKRLIHYLYRLRFNMIHFRLTDDQAFSLQLKSYPQLTMPSTTFESMNATYTPDELRDLVQYAKRYGIAIIPEINVPGHSGAWSGIPNLVLQCPDFACTTGYGIPMNVEHESLRPILTAVIEEVLEIFDHPPFLHLGGDEVHKSEACFQELGLEPFQYEHFERQLGEILQDVGYPDKNVIRWEVTGPNASNPQYRAGGIQHNWYYLASEKMNFDPSTTTIFSSWGLYMDANDYDGAEQIYYKTGRNYQKKKGSAVPIVPEAIIPATFELDTNFWMQRNVAARLIAVAMGAANMKLAGSEDILEMYNQTCLFMGLSPTVCDLQGFTAVPNVLYRIDHRKTWDTWIHGTCQRVGQRHVPAIS